MNLAAVSVSTKDLTTSVEFYKILGFEFEKFSDTDEHVESINGDGIKLMIDTESMVKSILGIKPTPSNHSQFAILYDSPAEVNERTELLTSKGFDVMKQPWDAFWGQRYAVVKDPNGYLVDVYAYLPKAKPV
ncbi:glyoxalase [bacterium]|uniref:Glyoxalase n=2 Tax=Katanobacteria TaxID=422282 RepID=A0A2M7X3M7_UNCKA|nr:glyoxalase [bacterium]PIP56504.1 MAG: glyoxalase [candidate division WWE3 bacterium CG22_combo_CG10-13_8_21_14_all_39_12]PJA40738.1 MAG: glyoxalase [candidate division WWE3 bacterium CG_4_9_14_3_um_filter_39_7]